MKTDADILDWLQAQSTLHQCVEILYVVDGYLVVLSRDGEPMGEGWHGETLREAFSKAVQS